MTDETLDAELVDRGYVVLPLLPPDVVEEVRRRYRSITPEGDHGLTVDYMRPDRGPMRAIAAEVVPLVAPHLAEVLVDQRPIMATFVTKHPGPLSEMFLHEDRTFVDERRLRAVTVWIPLVDVGEGVPNGGLRVVPRSHLLRLGLSGSSTPDVIRPYEAYLRSHLEDLTVPAGSAAVYDTRTIHASPPNLTDRPRVALVCAMAPRGEPLVHVRATGRRGRNVHRIDEDFFVEHHPRDVEQGMPTQYPVISSVNEEIILRPEDFTPLGTTPPDGPRPVVPPDLAERLDIDEEALPVATTRPTVSPSDLTLADLDADAGPAIAPVRSSETVGTVRVARVGRKLTDAGGTSVLWVARRRDRERRLVVMAPGSRAALDPGPRRRISFLEAPTVGAGIVVDGHFTAPQPGGELAVSEAATVELWNDGPGALILVTVVSGRASRSRSHRTRR